jgi:hypothetical protein
LLLSTATASSGLQLRQLPLQLLLLELGLCGRASLLHACHHAGRVALAVALVEAFLLAFALAFLLAEPLTSVVAIENAVVIGKSVVVAELAFAGFFANKLEDGISS